jgi:hypothetical protein
MAADGYLFFRRLLPAEQVLSAGAAVTGRLVAGGWLDERGIPSRQPKALDLREGLTDQAFRAAVFEAAFNQIPYLPPLRALIRRILGPKAFSYPVKVLRAVYPERPGARTRGRYVHYDYAVAGVQDMLTSWLPLMEVPARLGGLAVQPGGHLGPPQPPRPLSPGEPGWATTAYQPGDVIVFHCLTPHAALPNTSPALRLSGDFRWQLPDHPVPAEMIYGPARQPPEALSRMLARHRWWEPVPPGLSLRERTQLVVAPPRPSRLLPVVHRGWQHWHPPSGAVH